MDHVGFCHSLRREHPALASDLMEEFRAPVIDGAVLELLSRGRVSQEHFERSDEARRPVAMAPAARKRLIQAVEGSLNRKIRHPDAAGPCDYRGAISLQIRRLKECIQAGKPDYQPFMTR